MSGLPVEWAVVTCVDLTHYVTERRQLWRCSIVRGVKLEHELAHPIHLAGPLARVRQSNSLNGQAMVARISTLGLDRQDIFAERLSIGISTVDEPNVATYGADSDRWVSMFIHAILNEGRVEPDAKNIDFTWPAYRDRMCSQQWARNGAGSIDLRAFEELDRPRMGVRPRATPALDACTPDQRTEIERILTHMFKQWNRASCDANGLVIHASHALRSPVSQHAVFVTSDDIIVRLSTWERLRAIGFPGHIMKPGDAVQYFKQLGKHVGEQE